MQINACGTEHTARNLSFIFLSVEFLHVHKRCHHIYLEMSPSQNQHCSFLRGSVGNLAAKTLWDLWFGFLLVLFSLGTPHVQSFASWRRNTFHCYYLWRKLLQGAFVTFLMVDNGQPVTGRWWTWETAEIPLPAYTDVVVVWHTPCVWRGEITKYLRYTNAVLRVASVK